MIVRSPNMKKIPLISFSILLTFGTAKCFAQTAELPLSAAATQNKQQVATKPFTHAEVVQFIHTVQIEAANWKEAINSVDPSAYHFTPKVMVSVEKEKKALLLALDEIGRLSLPASEKNSATDLFAEFGVYSFLRDIACGADGLSDMLAGTSIAGVANAAELGQVQREVLKVSSPLYQEILTRILSIARSEESGGCK